MGRSLADCPVIGFIPVADRRRARAFYTETLGLRWVEEDPFAVVVEGGGTPIRIVEVQTAAPAPYTILGWMVSDIAGMAEALRGRGVVFERYGFMKQDDLGIWTSPSGARVAWFRDPDANVLSLTEVPPS
jgi:catechol 2,3-dioxygenase-like lactoylglutathione lyase family enzyme